MSSSQRPLHTTNFNLITILLNSRCLVLGFRALSLCLTVNLAFFLPVASALKVIETREGAGMEELEKSLSLLPAGMEEDFLDGASRRILEAAHDLRPMESLEALLPQICTEARKMAQADLVSQALGKAFSSLKTDSEERRFTGLVARVMIQGFPVRMSDSVPKSLPGASPSRGTVWTVSTSPTIHIDATKKLENWDDQKAIVVEPGGGAINVAIALASRGVPVRPLFFHAGETGRLLVQLIESRGVYVGDAMQLEGDEETRVSIVTSLDKAGNLLPKGTPVTPSAQKQLTAKLLDEGQGVKPGDIVVLSGSLAPGLPDDFYAELGKKLLLCGCIVIVDTRDTAAKKVLFAKPAATTIYSQNQFEFGNIVGIDPHDVQALIHKAMEIIRAQPIDQSIREIVITLGPKGAFSVTRDRVWEAQPPQVQVVSESGAGDASLAERVFRAWSGNEPRMGFLFGVAAGAASVLHPGTGGGTRTEIDHFAKSINLIEHVLIENQATGGGSGATIQGGLEEGALFAQMDRYL